MDWTDRKTCVLFGDGAGAAVLRRTEKDPPTGILSSHIYSDGTQTDLLIVPGGIGRTSFTYEGIDDKLYCLKMSGPSTFKVAVKRMSEVSLEALEANNLSRDDVGLVVPHQANQRIIEAVATKLKIPIDRFFINIDRYGNTGAASIPIAMHEARKEGEAPEGTVMLLTVLGAGLTWGAVLVRW